MLTLDLWDRGAPRYVGGQTILQWSFGTEVPPGMLAVRQSYSGVLGQRCLQVCWRSDNPTVEFWDRGAPRYVGGQTVLQWSFGTEVPPGMLAVRQCLRWILETEGSPGMCGVVQLDLLWHPEDESALYAVVSGTDAVFLFARLALPVETRLVALCTKQCLLCLLDHTTGGKWTRKETLGSSFYAI